MRRLLILGASLAAGLLAAAASGPVAAQAAGQTLDCAAAPTGAVDALVCDTPDLRSLNDRLTRLLPPDGEPPAPADALIERQGDWFARRATCATQANPTACLRAAYLERIVVLETRRTLPSPGLAVRCAGAPWGEAAVTLSRPVISAVVVRTADRRALAVAVIAEPTAGWTPALRVRDGTAAVTLVTREGKEIACAAG